MIARVFGIILLILTEAIGKRLEDFQIPIPVIGSQKMYISNMTTIFMQMSTKHLI